MENLFIFHNLLQIRLDAPLGAFRDYCELEFDHGKQKDKREAPVGIPTLNVSVDAPLATHGNIWALGKGLFFNESTQEILVSRDRGTSFFQPNNIYASLTNFFDVSARDLSIKICPGVLESRGVESFVRDVYRRFIKMDPRNRERKSAEFFVSQFLEPNIYRLFLKSGHLLLHAAALEKNGQCALIFGPQNVGKTTVTIRLAKHGWKMLGDDLCLLNEGAEVRSYVKPLKLERELLKNFPDAYRVAIEEKNKLDSALTALLPKICSRAGSFEIKAPPSSLGIDIAQKCQANIAFFLQRATKVDCSENVTVEKLSTEDAITLCEQHIAAEFDVNKHLDRDIRQNLALHFRTPGSLSLVTQDTSRIIRSAFADICAYVVTMACPDADALDAIEHTVSDLKRRE